jgi:hypothetical protein
MNESRMTPADLAEQAERRSPAVSSAARVIAARWGCTPELAQLGLDRGWLKWN